MVANMMAIRVDAIPYYFSQFHHVNASFFSPKYVIKTKAKPVISCGSQLQQRRSGNYMPSLWDYNYIQSLNTINNLESEQMLKAYELRKQVRELLIMEEIKKKPMNEILELVDSLQRLGISYHFEKEIKEALSFVYEKRSDVRKRDLYSTAIEFRLLRHHGFSISQDVFDCFKNEKGEFDAVHGDDIKGLLELYEASFMLIPGENSLELARNFAENLLQTKLEEGYLENDETMSAMVQKALEMPTHWRVLRSHSRWFINLHQQCKAGMNPAVFQLAELDFNIVLAHHQAELKYLSIWWKRIGLAEVLPFARDRLVESYFFSLSIPFQPENGYSRIVYTKASMLVVMIDDIFDVYGTMEELHLFNNATQSWESEDIEKLPHYMKSCFRELDYFINELAFVVLNEQGILITPFLRRSWADLCRSYLKEAEWFSKGYTPTLEKYISNAWVSISAPLLLTHAYFFLAKPVTNGAIQQLFKPHNLIRYSGLILRLANDLGTSPDEAKRGDVPKSVQCYIHETKASIEEGRRKVKLLMDETWKKINEELKNAAVSPLPQVFIDYSVELGRMAMHFYDTGDGFGMGTPRMKQSIAQVLFEPLQ